MICFRLLDSDDPAAPLAEAVAKVRDGLGESQTFLLDPNVFRQVPNAPFSYWASNGLRSIFADTLPLESKGREARLGSGARNDFRYLRLSWESFTSVQHSNGIWIPFAKGGTYSKFYSDIHLLVDWEPRRRTFLGFFGRSGREIPRPESVGYFFRPGITWPRRTGGLSFRVMPAECIFSDKGPATFIDGDDTHSALSLMAILNSQPFVALVGLQLARIELAQSYEVGLIQQTPVPDLSLNHATQLALRSKSAWSIKRHADTSNLNSHAFYAPTLLPGELGSRNNDNANAFPP